MNSIITLLMGVILGVITCFSVHEDQFRYITISITDNKKLYSLQKQVDYYQNIERALVGINASNEQISYLLQASAKYNVDAEWLGALMYSESSCIHRRHAEKGVVGLCGINTNANKNLPYNPYTDSGNIMDSAYLLRNYLDVYKTYPKAIKRYKGYSKKGEVQALEVQRIYRSMQ